MLKITLDFWFRIVLPNAFRKTFKAIGIVGVIMELIVSGVADLIEGGGIGLLTLCIWGILLLLTVLVFVFREPAKLYNELGGFVEKPIILSPELHPDPIGGVNYFRGLRVKNISPFDVEECILRLMEATNLDSGESIIRREEDLRWSLRHGENRCEPKKVSGGGLYNLCDVARWEKETEQAFFVTCVSVGRDIPIGEHELKIRITGTWKEHTINYEQRMILVFDGTRILMDDEREINRE